MKFLRYCLFALVLLRLLTGTAWAMPVMPMVTAAIVMTTTDTTEEIPCHAMADEDDAPLLQAHPDHTNAPCNLLCHICCMGCAAALPVLPVSTEPPRHAVPAHPAQDVARWQHTPDLRPPI